MAQHIIRLRSAADDGLRKLAARERRTPKEQAAVIVERELERRGLLPEPAIKSVEPQPESADVNA